MNLQRYIKDNLELIVDLDTGEVFASQSAIARMVGKNESTIRYWITSQNISTKRLGIPTGTGLKTSQLLDESAIKQALAKYNPDLLLKCVDAGLRIYLHGLAGFKYEAKVDPRLPKDYLEALEQLLESKKQEKKLELEKLKLKKQIEEAKPKVEFAETIATSPSSVDFATYAKMLGGVGRNRLMAKLREFGILMKNSRLPYQKWIDAGWFEVTHSIVNDKPYPVARITGRGQIEIKQKILC